MTTAHRHLSLVPTDADVIQFPQHPRIRHNALRHAVLREAANGIITRDDRHVAINGKPTSPATRAAIADLVDAGCIDWFTFGPAKDEHAQVGIGQAGWITEAGVRQLAEWDGHSGGGNAA